MSYEIHITVRKADAERAFKIGEEYGWKTSQIAGDPILGKATYAYLTAHRHAFQEVYPFMSSVVKALQSAGIYVVREKIEIIVHDKRYPPPAYTAEELERDNPHNQWLQEG